MALMSSMRIVASIIRLPILADEQLCPVRCEQYQPLRRTENAKDRFSSSAKTANGGV
ncbi:MAG: hypothetical protein LBI61_01305 [Puniceicoccales bacterium]|nr:hypothetical protein [Puniceicoccales bacterium]